MSGNVSQYEPSGSVSEDVIGLRLAKAFVLIGTRSR
jgi:hypothetical protein